MENHQCLTDEAFVRQFQSCQLLPADFTHEAHLRLAWIHIKEQGIQEAIRLVRGQICNYVEHLGAAEKYHETLTVAATKAVYHFVLQSKSNRFAEFVSEFPRLKTSFFHLMHAHYSPALLQSNRAKHQYVEPDLLPFDDI